MATIVLIESGGHASASRAIVEARRAGFDVTVVSPDPDRYRRGERGSDADSATDTDTAVARLIGADTGDVRALIDRLRALNAAEPIAGVLTPADDRLPTVAAVAEALDLPGADPQAVRVCRDRHRTRVALARRPFTPRFAVVDVLEGLPSALDRVGLPCVITPAARGIAKPRVVHSRREAIGHTESLAARYPEQRRTTPLALVEEWVRGAAFTVETFSSGGQIRAIGVTGHGAGAGYGGTARIAAPELVFPAPLPPAQYQALCSTAITAIRQIGLDFGPAHTELRLTPTGPKLIAIHPRLGGNRIPELVRLATGVDLRRAALRAATGGPIDLTPTRDRAAGIRFLGSGSAEGSPRRHSPAPGERPGGADTEAIARGTDPSARADQSRTGYVVAEAATADLVPSRLDDALARAGGRLEYVA